MIRTDCGTFSAAGDGDDVGAEESVALRRAVAGDTDVDMAYGRTWVSTDQQRTETRAQ